MNDHESSPRGNALKREARPDVNTKIQALLTAEVQRLQSISEDGSLAEVLNGICSALDCRIGNVVSVISLPAAENAGHTGITMNAARFGLYTLCSERIVAQDDELVGSIAIYSSVPRSPSAREFQWIDRAKCLAAIAIKIHKEAGHQSDPDVFGKTLLAGNVFEWPVSTRKRSTSK